MPPPFRWTGTCVPGRFQSGKSGRPSDRSINCWTASVPGLSPVKKEPGVFWADASGLDKLYGSLEAWARQIDFQLSRLKFPASIVIGFSRFGSYALAKAERLVTVLPSPEVEQAQGRRVSLLHLQPRSQAERSAGEAGDSHPGRLAAASRSRHPTPPWRASPQPLPPCLGRAAAAAPAPQHPRASPRPHGPE